MKREVEVNTMKREKSNKERDERTCKERQEWEVDGNAGQIV